MQSWSFPNVGQRSQSRSSDQNLWYHWKGLLIRNKLAKYESPISQDVFVKHGCPQRQQSKNMAKISRSYILTPPDPQGHVLSVKCEEPIDELTVQVLLLYYHQNLKYCALFVSGTELQTDGQKRYEQKCALHKISWENMNHSDFTLFIFT